VALTVVDASILIALLDSDDGLHAAATAALLAHAGDELMISASAYSEALIRPARAGRLEEAKAVVGALLMEVVPLSQPIAEAAAMLRARHQALRLPDALVIATGTSLDAGSILTGDSRWRGLAALVEVVG
jgi:predicted nucleic acid-binding protein